MKPSTVSFTEGCFVLGEFVADLSDPAAGPTGLQPLRTSKEAQLALAECLGHQAVLEMNRGDFPRALSLLEEQRALHEQLDDPVRLQVCLGNLAKAQRALGNEPAALELLKEQEAILRRLASASS